MEGMVNNFRVIHNGHCMAFRGPRETFYLEVCGLQVNGSPENLVADYFNLQIDGWDTKVVLELTESNGEAKFVVSFFNDDTALTRYASRTYSAYNLPKKYIASAKRLLRGYSMVFYNNRCAFNYPAEWGTF